MTLTRPIISHAMFLPGSDNDLIVRAGARIMYSISREGFGPEVEKKVGLIERFGRPGAVLPVFSAGEIDVRAHLAERADTEHESVAGYLRACKAIARRVGADRFGVVVPVPPVDVNPAAVWFPVVGDIGARVRAQATLRAALTSAVADDPDAYLLDFSDILQTADDGSMPEAHTIDGMHTNAATVARIRPRVETFRATTLDL